MIPMSRSAAFVAGICAAAAILAGCGEKIVYRDRDPVNPPPDPTHGFLGYFTPAERQTTCGNCHADYQADWINTAHASALAGLVGSGSAQSFCYPCHTISRKGNELTEAAGYENVQTDVYHDVQCESCHGAGQAHVERPGQNLLLASADITDDRNGGCGECHTGNHHPFVEQWSQSAHAAPNPFPAGREECAGCHRGQAALAAAGVRKGYKERESTEHLAITCVVCHDPHLNIHAGQLRLPIDTPSAEQHLCARCHDRRSIPDPASSHGLEPHAPETALLFGTAGWFAPGMNISPGQLVGSHGVAGNPTLCAGCHVVSYPTTDSEGNFFQSTGHHFAALPCDDGTNPPAPGTCGYSESERSYFGCTQCHATEAIAAGQFTTKRDDLTATAADLKSQLDQVDPGGEDPGGPIDPSDPTFTVAEGCLFNYNLANHGGGTEPATGHNFLLVKALLLGSIQAMTDEYGVVPVSGRDARRELREHLSRRGS